MGDKAQIAMEFILLIGVAFFVIVALLASIMSLSTDNTKMKAYQDMDDLGRSLQQEFLLASQLEDGYTRKINMPITIGNVHYNTTIGQSNPTNSYLMIQYDGSELFYLIPPVTGNLTYGNNFLKKNNGTLTLN
jgi:hypothetical protein